MADLISAISSLMWPTLVVVALLIFGRQLLSKLRSSGDVTLEVGGLRLSLQQATDQQSEVISSLVQEVSSLRHQLNDVGQSYEQVVHQLDELSNREPLIEHGLLEPGASLDRDPEGLDQDGAAKQEPETSLLQRENSQLRSILWVDDLPENHAVLADLWRRGGAEVEFVRSTYDAIHRLKGHRYDLIISDISRRESNVVVPDAGIHLLEEVRTMDSSTPFVLYGDIGGLSENARAAGATMVTDSTFELMEFVREPGRVSKKVVMDEIAAALGKKPLRMSTGSTEPRALFDLINEELGLGMPAHLTKQQIARAIVESTGEVWERDFESRGGTVTLKGLTAVREAVRSLTEGEHAAGERLR